MITDVGGMPPAVIVVGGYRNGVTQFVHCSGRPADPRPGRWRSRPRRVYGDRGYDTAASCAPCALPVIAGQDIPAAPVSAMSMYQISHGSPAAMACAVDHPAEVLLCLRWPAWVSQRHRRWTAMPDDLTRAGSIMSRGTRTASGATVALPWKHADVQVRLGPCPRDILWHQLNAAQPASCSCSTIWPPSWTKPPGPTRRRPTSR